ncbi:MAG: ATP-binding protein [Mariprofundaceae bacterium]|nr:ATP-binding protein [Mariprofundaceae bacterium]
MQRNMYERSKAQQKAILLLSKNQWLAGHYHILESIYLITSTTAKTLGVQQCSVWKYENNHASLRCLDIYDDKQQNHHANALLEAKDFPDYFNALRQEEMLIADDVLINTATYELCNTYLTPLGITSKIDVPIYLEGQMIGVFCCEHVGTKKIWKPDEKTFITSIVNLISTAFELDHHKQHSDDLHANQHQLELLVHERTKSLEKKNKELESFSYSISHDLHAPLRHISGYLTILEEVYLHHIDSQGQEYLKKVHNGVEKMQSMIDSMLSLSKISMHDMRKVDINLSEFIHDIAIPFTPESPPFNFKINKTPKITGDRGLIQIALSNLLENAIKYTEKTAHAQIEFGSNEVEGKTVYYLKDNGCGFDIQYAHKLFRVFQRLHHEKDFKGTGIGLSTVKRIIRKHGGDIWAKGEVNAGATFFFTFGD